MVNILVTGSNGQLGSELQALHVKYKEYNFFFSNKETLNISDKESISLTCKQNSITHIINCAAYTAVDKAEEDKANADTINHLAVKYLSEVAKEQSISLIHISTDYVFDGENYKPYTETDNTNPQGVYGKTKLEGEEELLHVSPKNSIIIRTSWVYSSFGNNFVKTMLRLAKERDELNVIFDQVGTPTYAKDLAQAVLEILPNIENSKPQIYHYSNEGVLSWYDFAKEIMKMAKLTCKVNPIETSQYPTPATRPHYSLLNKSKIKKEFELIIPYWKDSLSECLQVLGERRK
jgi:dTDP-4-dehydrorhamnose reductase